MSDDFSMKSLLPEREDVIAVPCPDYREAP
jgi:hypothetical protein